MNHKKLTEKLALLKDGQIVDIDGLPFSAKILNGGELSIPCDFCNVDCLCHGDIAEVCIRLDYSGKHRWYLFLET